MMCCDKCKERVLEDRKPFNVVMKVGQGKEWVDAVLLMEATLCADCCERLSKDVQNVFCNFFGGDDAIDLVIKVVDNEFATYWGGKFTKVKPLIDHLHGEISVRKSPVEQETETALDSDEEGE